MKTGYKNKQIMSEDEKTKGAEIKKPERKKRQFFYPQYGKTVWADSKEEADKIVLADES
jgi:hypothetical protein